MITYNTIQAIILAAGKSTRFKTGKSKLLTPLCGQDLILYPINALSKLTIATTIVAGQNKIELEKITKKTNANSLNFIQQTDQKGTGDALLCSQPEWQKEHILVINGDMPLITEKIISELCQKHIATKNVVTFATAHHPELDGYGRVIKNENSIEIIENKDFTGDATINCCINAGLYIFKKSFLEQTINNLTQHKNSNEFYITDLIKIASSTNQKISTIQVPFDAIRGVNTLKELWACEQIKRSELMSYWMENGVRFSMAQEVHIDVDVEIGAGSIIESGAQLLNGTKIGKNTIIGPYSLIDNCEIDSNVEIKSHSVIKDSKIHSGASIGPFAHIHNKSTIKEEAVIGCFVEVVRSTIGPQSKAKHLTYLGDTTTESRCNIGAGTITCNYNGVSKEKTRIGSGSFIGSNNSIIAPITIGDNAITAASSTITKNVPNEALAISRAHQENKEGYAPKLLNKYKNKKAESSKKNQHEQII